jgi:AcrR family transcriptional regulator
MMAIDPLASSPTEAAPNADWHRRVVGRSLDGARKRSIDRGARLIRAAEAVLERSGGSGLTVQEVADEAGQSLRTLYQYFESKDDLLLAVFEEAMHTYAHMIRAAITEFSEPVERLAAGILASVRIPSLHNRAGMDRGLSRLRLQLGQTNPESLALSQAPVTELLRELVADAMATSPGIELGVDQATYMLSSLRTAFAMSATLGNDLALDSPDPIDLSYLSLAGMGIGRPRSWHEEIDARLHLTDRDGPAVLRDLAQ